MNLISKVKLRKLPITITNIAWAKINSIVNNTNNNYGMIFTASSGGCNGFNYKLNLLDKEIYEINKKNNSTFLEYNNTKVFIDPIVEMYLLNTKIDYITEDYSKNIYENKFTFTPDKSIANSCGCGTSFSPLK